MHGGPFGGKAMAYNSHLIPVIINGLRVGAYVWDEDHWVWERE
jgi:hypothetical protein